MFHKPDKNSLWSCNQTFALNLSITIPYTVNIFAQRFTIFTVFRNLSSINIEIQISWTLFYVTLRLVCLLHNWPVLRIPVIHKIMCLLNFCVWKLHAYFKVYMTQNFLSPSWKDLLKQYNNFFCSFSFSFF